MFVSRNRTAFLAEVFVSTDKLGVKSAVVVVRATFAVGPEGTTTASRNQMPFVFADTHYGDPQKTAVMLETDFVPVKPHAEVLLNAYAVAPEGRPVEALEVALLGPKLAKRAIVTGERHWVDSLVGPRPTRPVPFRQMPLAWHLAFGGGDNSDKDPRKHGCCMQNPIGTGFHVNQSGRTIVGLPLPCIEHPDHRIQSWNDTPPPVGFGPVPRFASTRVAHAGTYDQRWLDHVRPFLPQDFDDRYFQAAPEDQQFEAITPGAEYTCLNMSPEAPFVVRTPALHVSAKFLYDDRTVIKVVRADTLILEPHERRIIVVGRASMVLPRKFTRLREIQVEPDGPAVPIRRPGSRPPTSDQANRERD